MDVDSRHPPSPFAPCHQAAAADGCPREYVRDGKGSKDRVTMLPESLKKSLHDHLGKTQEIHERDLAEGWGRVQMPDAMDSKYPNAPAAWRWQWTSPPREPMEEHDDVRPCPQPRTGGRS